MTTEPTAPKGERLEIRLDLPLATAFNAKLLKHGWEAAPVLRALIAEWVAGDNFLLPQQVGRQRDRAKPRPAKKKTRA